MPKIDNEFSDLEKEILKKHVHPNAHARREKAATKWFVETMGRTNRASIDPRTGLQRVRPEDWMRTRRGVTRPPVPGQMFVYWYDPKHKDTLPYYDRFPIVLVIDLYQDGWLGLNLHYLPSLYRARLLGLILGTMRSTKMTREAKARVTYELIKSTSRWRVAMPALKRYLHSHVVSKIVRVPPTEWEQTVFLPMDTWHGAVRQKVWIDSVKQIQGTA